MRKQQKYWSFKIVDFFFEKNQNLPLLIDAICNESWKISTQNQKRV